MRAGETLHPITPAQSVSTITRNTRRLYGAERIITEMDRPHLDPGWCRPQIKAGLAAAWIGHRAADPQMSVTLAT